MPNNEPAKDEIFPKGTKKSYALVEVMNREGPMVGKGPEDTVFAFPIVLLWEVILLLGVTLGIFLFSLFKQAPLEEIANPLITTDPAKAPWYFLGLQELLEHMHPTLAGVLIPTALILFLLALPYIDNSNSNAGIWFSSKRGRRISLLSALYALVVMPAYIFLDNLFPLREVLRGVVADWVAQGVLPAAIIGLLVIVPAYLLWRRKVSTREMMLALFTIMFVSAIIFTISGFLFRGPGFKLFLPWDMPGGYNPWDSF